MKYINTLSVLALASTSLAQTFSDCDPTKKTGCPTKPGLATADYSTDFRQGASAAADWTTTTGSVNYVADGSEFSITKLGEGPTIQSNFYVFFGYVEVVAKAAPGAGIVSSFVMESDDLDEIDWEWIGSDTAQAQSNYFGKGNTTTYDRGAFHPVATPESAFHTYAVNWTKETTTWFIDGTAVRTLNFADAVGGQNYPQTPMNIRIGNWVAGDPKNAPGTIQWAGGLTDFSQGPFNMFVQSVKIVNYNPGTSYKYNDQSGSWESISVLTVAAEVQVTNESSNSTTGPGAVPFDSSSSEGRRLTASETGKKPCSTISKSGKTGLAASATAASGSKPSVVSINLGRTGNSGAAAAATATGPAAAAVNGSLPSVVSINLGSNNGGAAAAATGLLSNSSAGSGGIVAQGAPLSNDTLPTFTIRPGGAAENGSPTTAAGTTLNTGITTAAAASVAASGGTSFSLGGTSTTSATAQQQTTNAGRRLEMGGAAIAGLVGLLVAW